MSKLENIVAWSLVATGFILGYMFFDGILETIQNNKHSVEHVNAIDTGEFKKVDIGNDKVYTFTKNGIKYIVIESKAEED